MYYLTRNKLKKPWKNEQKLMAVNAMDKHILFAPLFVEKNLWHSPCTNCQNNYERFLCKRGKQNELG